MAEVDLARLPDDVAALIAALRPGEELLITRDAAPIATIRGPDGVLEGEIVPTAESQEDIGPPRPGYDAVTVVATAMTLSERARASLSAELGTEYIVVDMPSAPSTADVLLIPPASPQLIGHLRSMFPGARIVVTEIEDDEFGVSYRGPIGRMLDAGAETYLPSTTVADLARNLDLAVTRRPQLTGSGSARPEIERRRPNA